MDPDADSEQAVSQIFRTTIFTVVFTTCHSYSTDTTASIKLHFTPAAVTKTEKTAPPVKKKKKTIYLTFDDGPNKGTGNMMQIVEEEQVPVTVFIVGEHVYGSTAQSAIFDSLKKSRLFEIANHSYTHAFHNKFTTFYEVPDSAVKDFLRCADSLNLTANIIRTPGRNIWRAAGINSTDIKKTKDAADTLEKHQFIIVGWDLEWHYDQELNLQNTSDEMVQQVDSMFVNAKTKTLDHLVILAHDQVYADGKDSTQLHQFIIKLKAKGEYEFETVSKYPGIKKTDQ